MIEKPTIIYSPGTTAEPLLWTRLITDHLIVYVNR